ncbi:uncharacterized protein rab44 isoform X2 [Trachinotus anak]|uniref:uncharacterized protein rab44 isoform X2 n=1 Tax=Trachinotus anak TaxID=443729 RepID=UPI0039F16A5B
MSTQRTKKKRLGSHRRVANQNETPKADELHVMDSTSVAQCHIPEENSESLSILSNPDSQPETQHPPSPDLTLSRRKLGSRRKNKGLHVKDSTNETYHEHREEVEENSKGNEAQSERQEELSKGSGEDISATHDSSLYSALTSGYSCEVQNPTTTKCSEDVLENLITQSGNQKADQDENETNSEGTSFSCKLLETILEVTDKSGTLQSEEVKENTHHVDSSHLTSSSTLSCPTADQQLISQSDSREMPEELLSVYSATEEENREREEDTNLLMQDGNLQSNYLMSESHEESVVPGFSTTAEITTDKNSLRQNTEFECSVEQGTSSSSPTEELPADENPNKQFSLPLDSQPQDTSVRIEEQTNTNFNPTLNRRKLGSRRRNKGRQHVNDHETKEDVVENIRGNGAFETTQTSSVINTAVLVSPMETTLEGTDNSDNHQTERLSGQIKEIAHLVDNSALHSSTLHPTPSDDQQLINQLNIREMPHEEFSRVDFVTDTERKEREEDTDLLRQWGILQSNNLVSESRVISDDVNVNQPTEMQEIHLTECSPGSLINDSTENSEIHFANLTDQAEVSDTYQSVAESHHKPKEEHVEDITGNEALRTMSSALQTIQEELSPEADLESLIPKSEYLQEGHDERETDFKVEMSDKSKEATLEEMEKSDTLQSEEVNNTHSEETVIEVHEQEIKPTQIQEIHEGDYTFEDVTHVTAENCDSCSVNLTDQDEVRHTYQSELLVKSVDDPDPMQDVSDPDDKQDQHPIKESSMEVSDQIHEGNIAQDTNKSQTSDIERADTALSRVYENEMEESKSSLQTLESETNAPSDSTPQDNSLKMDKQNGNDLNPIGNRRKLGSTRRNKGRQHFKGSGAESYHKPTEDVVGNTTDNEALETTKMPLMIETEVQETSVETMLEGKDKFDLSHTEDVSDKIKENAHVTTSELTSISVYSSPTVDQQVIDNSNVREMENGELPGVSSATDTESRERDEDTDLLRQADNLVCESHLKSEGVESSNIQEISTEESSRGQHTEPEGSVEQARLSSPKEELSTNEEQNEHFSLCEVRGAQHSEDAVKKVHEEEEVKPTQIQEIHLIDYSSESVIHDATENSEIYSANLTDQEEVRPTYQSELLVKSIDDPAPTQQVSGPDDKQDEHPTKESSVEVLDRIDEDYLVQDTNKSQPSNIERADTALCQVYENEGRVEDDIKPTAEQTCHQEKERHLSEMEESKSSLQTLESEPNVPLNLQPQDNSVKIDEQNDTNFNPIGNRRKLGSSRRNKGRQHNKSSGAASYHHPAKEDIEDIKGNEDLQTTMSLALQTSQEDNEQDIILSVIGANTLNSESMSDYSSEVQNRATTTEMSDKSMEATLEEMDKSDTLQSEEVNDTRSEDTVNEVHEQEIKPTQIQEIHEGDYFFESVTHVTAENSDSCSGNLTDQDEVRHTYQSELLVKSIDDPVPMQDVSDPDDKQDQHPIKQSSMEVSDQTDEDNLAQDTNKSQTSDIERADTALSQAYENEGRVEDYIKPTAEQTSHQEKQVLLSEMEERESSLQTLESETNAPSDSQPQDNSVQIDRQNDNDLNPIGNRRKLGSTRRNKGRQHFKGSGAESYHKPTEDVVGNTTDNEALETTKMSLMIETEVQETSVETMLEGKDKFDLSHTEDISDKIKENALVTTSELTSISVYSSPTVDQQVIDNSNVREMENEELPGVSSATDTESRERDEDTDLLRQADNLVCESHLKSEGVESSNIQEISTEESSRGQHTEPEGSVEQARLSSPKEELSTNEEQNEHFSLCEVRGAQHSEDAVKKVHEEEEVKPTQIQEIHLIDYSSESVIHDATENSEIYSANLTDQEEVRPTYQSELLVKSIDDPAPTQQVSGPDDKQDEQPTKESSVEVLDRIDEDYLVQDTNKSQPSNIERADTALCQVYENEGRVEDDIKPTAEQTCHQEKERHLSEMEESKSSLQTLESEPNVPLNLQPQDNSVKIDEQNDTNFNPIGNRRKLGSSRRNKGRQHNKSSGAASYHHPAKEDVEDIKGNEDLQTTMSLALQTSQEDNEQDIILSVIGANTLNSESMSDYSSEVQNRATTTEMSDKSMEATLEEMDKSDTLQSEEVNDTRSEDTVNEVHEQEIKPTQIQEIHEGDYFFESVTHVTAENSDSCSGNLTDQDEVRHTYQSELLVKSIDDPVPMQDVSDPDDKQDQHPIKQSSMEVSDQTDEDNLAQDTNKSQTSDIERADTALSQAYENEGRVEDYIKPTAVQTSHQEKQVLLSEMEESESSLQTLESETNAPSDSQPQDNSVQIDRQNDNDLNPIGNRRKLGSTRRNKGRQHFKGSGAESYHKPTEDVVGNTTDNEALETTKMSLMIETEVQETSVETMLEGKDKFDLSHTEDISDKIKENALVTTSELTSISVYSSPTVDQQVIDNSNVREMENEELPGVSSATDTESRERDEDTDLLRQANNLVCESHLKSEGVESSNIQEISTDESSRGQHTEPEGSVEQARLSSPKEELSTNEEQNEHFSLYEVRGAQHSEDAVKKVHEEEEVKPTQIQEIHLIDYSSESVIHDATENSEIYSANLTDQEEVRPTYQSELLVKSIDDPSPTQQVSGPDDKQDEHPTKESSVEVLDRIDEDYLVQDTNKSQPSNIERADTALCQVYENEGRVEDDIKPTAEQTCHQEKERHLSEMEESKSSLQTLESEPNVPLNLQPQDNSVKIDEQNDTNFNPIGNRRKLGSSRRNKGRQHNKSSGAASYHHPAKEDIEDIKGNEDLQTTMSLALQTSQEDNEQDIILSVIGANTLNSESMSDYSSEVQNRATTTEMSDKSMEATLEEMDKSDTLQSEEVNDTRSEDTVNEVHEQEIKPTQIQEIHEGDYFFESVTHVTAENSDSCSGNLTDQDEVRHTYQSELLVKSIDDPVPMQDVSDPDDKQDQHPIKQSSMEVSDQTDEDNLAQDTNKSQTSDIERADTALSQAYENEGRVEDYIKPTAVQTSHQEKPELLSEMEESKSSLQTLESETNAPSDSQPQDNSLKMDKQNGNDLNPTGNRRKLGSTRRNKGRQHDKGSGAESYHKPTEDVVGNTTDNEALETTKMSLTIETEVQETSMEIILEGKDKFDLSQTEDISDNIMENAHVTTPELTSISVYSSPTVDQQVTDQSNDREMLSSATDTESKEKDEDTDLLRQWGILEAINLVNVSHLNSEGIESSITPEITTEKNSFRQHTEPGFTVEQATVSSPKEELSTNEEQNEHFNFSEVKSGQQSEEAVREVHGEEEIKLPEMQKMHQFDYSSIKESSPSLQTLQSEVRSPLDSQPMDNSQSIKEETDSGFKSTGNRRKLGSSRRNKVRQHIPDSVPEPYTKLKEEVVENTRGDKGSETQQIPLGTETAKQEELKDHTDVGFKPAEKIRTIRSTVKKEEKMPGEDTTLSQNIMDSSTIVTTDTTLRSDKNDSLKPTEEVSEERKEHIKEPENLTVLTGYDTIKIDLIQSEKDSEETSIDVQGPGQVEVREECEDPANKDHAAQEINISNVVTHAELSSACENKSDTWATFDIGHQKKLTANPAGDVSEESGISTATDAVNSQQDIQEKNPVGNSENLLEKVKQRKRKMGSTRRTQLNRKQEGETHNKDETFESNFGMEVDVRNLDRMEVEELPLIATTAVSQKENAQSSLRTVYKEQQETNETGSVHDKQQMQQSSTSDLQTVESNIKAGIDDSMVHLPEWSASHNEEVAYPVTFVHGVDVRDGEGNVDFSVVPPQLDDFASTEMRTTSMVVGRNGHSVNQLLSSNTEGAVNTDSDVTLSFSETAQSTQNDEGSTEVIKVLHDQALNSAEAPTMTVADLAKVNSVVKGGVVEENTNAQASAQEPNNVNEEAQDTNVEMKNASPNFSSTNRRRKLGSTRRNLESRSKGEYLHQKQEVDNEATATNVGDVLSEGVPGIKEKELQLHSEHKDGDSEQRKEKVFETVEYSHIGESQLEPVVYQTVEENPDSLSQLVETEHQLSPDHLPATPSTSPKHDVMPESAAGGRRRKMGSHRKSHGHQRFENQTAREDRIDVQKVRDVSLTDESAIKTAKEHTEGSLSLDEILEVDESNQKTSSNISISKATEHTGPKSEKAPKLTPVQYPQAEIRLSQESRKKVSFGTDVRSKSYDVLLVGNSNVGKTSFMKRAQSGKFSLDLPASVGLDSCMWTVVVDGKPVVLQLWDTAGQERFHSITRQVFHKARAFLLMYDISSSQSFSAVSYWANCIQEGAAENMPILLLGNKSDCTERQVKAEEGESLAKEYNFEFMECSAATGENVIQSLETVARMLSQKVDTTEEALVLHKEPPQKKRSGCC